MKDTYDNSCKYNNFFGFNGSNLYKSLVWINLKSHTNL